MYLSAGFIFSSFPLLIAGASEHKRDFANKGNARNPFRLSPKNGMTPRVALMYGSLDEISLRF